MTGPAAGVVAPAGPASVDGRPARDAVVAASVLRRFGVAVEGSVLLASEDVEVRRLHLRDGGRRLLKLHPAAGADKALFQASAMDHLAGAAPVPRLHRARSGEPLATDPALPGERLELMDWLDGEPAFRVPSSRALRTSMGRTLAAIDRGLADFRAPCASPANPFDMEAAAGRRDRLVQVATPAHREAAEAGFAMALAAGPPFGEGALRRQVIHGDLSLHNVVVDPGEPGRVAGVFDFGDCLENPLVCDLAIAASHLVGSADDPLEGPCDLVRGYAAAAPLQDGELALLLRLVRLRLAAMIVTNHGLAAARPSHAGHIMKNVGKSAEGLRRLAPIGEAEAAARLARAASEGAAMQRPLMVNTFDPGGGARLPDDTRALVARRARVMGRTAKLFYEEPIHVVRASGVRLYDAHGRSYLDVYNNVPSVGHCHPRVVEAAAAQMATLNIHNRYLNDVTVAYAEELLATFPPALDNVLFNNSGSEAADLALRMARAQTGATGVIVTDNGYHGLTCAIAEISPSLGEAVGLGPHVRVVPAPDRYRQGEAVGERFAQAVAEAAADLQRNGFGVAALYADTIFSSDGVFSDPPGFLKGAVEAVRAAGGLFVADEVQPGFGRTGERMWGFERHGVVPDLVFIGKPMANGLPMAAVIASSARVEAFGVRTRYSSTFGGNPVCCAAAGAVLAVIRDEELVENARTIGARMQAGLKGLAARHPSIGEVRGAGLFIGVDFVSDREAKTPDPAKALAVVNGLRRRRVLISAAGRAGHALKIRPPLCFSSADADEFLDAVAAVLDEEDAA